MENHIDARLLLDMQALRESPPNIIYHYCSMEALLGILDSGRIWLSDINATNDSLEGVWLDSKLQMLHQGINKDSELPQHYKEFKQGNPHIFISCFTEEDDILSQWRGYGDDGKGVAIGFLVNRFCVACENENSMLSLNQVIYDDSLQFGNIAALFRAYETEEFDEKYRVLESLYLLSTVSKNRAFAEEKEWRIIYRPMVFDKKHIHGALEDARYRISNGRVVKYYSLPINTGSIVRVVLGPKNQNDRKFISDFFSFYGMHPDIESSEASYRS